MPRHRVIAAFVLAVCTSCTTTPPIACENDTECATDEICEANACVAGEGEGEGEGEGIRVPSSAQVTAFCDHFNACNVDNGGQADPGCAATGNAEIDSTRTDPTCAPYLSALLDVLLCFTDATCAQLTSDPPACSAQVQSVENAQTSCQALAQPPPDIDAGPRP